MKKTNKLRNFISYKSKKQVERNIFFIYIGFIITGIVFFTFFRYLIIQPPVYIKINKEIYRDTTKTHDLFLYSLGKYESGNDYQSINRLGYLGKYQFSPETIKQLKIKCTPQEFIDQPMLQERTMYLYLKYNKNELKEYIGKYQFTWQHDVYITESGILSAAHLVGPNNIKKFFETGHNSTDANGVSVKNYMKLFGGYNLEFK